MFYMHVNTQIVYKRICQRSERHSVPDYDCLDTMKRRLFAGPVNEHSYYYYYYYYCYYYYYFLIYCNWAFTQWQ
jgi:hypothetical protein